MTVTQQEGTTPHKTRIEDNESVVRKAYSKLGYLRMASFPIILIVCVLEMTMPLDHRPSTRIAEASGNFTRVFLDAIHQAEASRQVAIEGEVNKIRGHYLSYMKGLEAKFQIKVAEIQNYNEIAKLSYVKLAERANEAFKQIMLLEQQLLQSQIHSYQESTGGKRFMSNVFDLLCGFLEIGCNKSENLRREMYTDLKNISDLERTQRFKDILQQRDITKFVTIDHALRGLEADFKNIPYFFDEVDQKIRSDLFTPIHQNENFEKKPSPFVNDHAMVKMSKGMSNKMMVQSPHDIQNFVLNKPSAYKQPILQSMVGQRLKFEFIKSGKPFFLDLYETHVTVTYTSGKQRDFSYKFLNKNKLCLINPDDASAYLGCKIFKSYNGKTGWWSIEPNQNDPEKVTAILVSHDVMDDAE